MIAFLLLSFVKKKKEKKRGTEEEKTRKKKNSQLAQVHLQHNCNCQPIKLGRGKRVHSAVNLSSEVKDSKLRPLMFWLAQFAQANNTCVQRSGVAFTSLMVSNLVMNGNIRNSLEPNGSCDIVKVRTLPLLCCTLVRYTELRPRTWDGVIHSCQQRHHASQDISSCVAMENGRMKLKQRHEHRAIHLTRDTKSTSITLNHKWPLTCPHSCTQGGSSPFSWWQWKHLASRSH